MGVRDDGAPPREPAPLGRMGARPSVRCGVVRNAAGEVTLTFRLEESWDSSAWQLQHPVSAGGAVSIADGSRRGSP